MSATRLEEIVSHFDNLLSVSSTPDYASALNGLQVEHRGPVHKLAAAVDCSLRTIQGALQSGANLLLVHHGLFWSGLQPLTGRHYLRTQLLLANDVALYSAHLPLDAHPVIGNSRLLAYELDLEPTAGFGRFESIFCGVRGTVDLETASLLARVRRFARNQGGEAIASTFVAGRRTRRWAICSGAGANADTLQEAADLVIDTLIVGEGPHWSAVEAEERGLVIIYAGHYATETLGVRQLATIGAEHFGLPWAFIEAPTGL